MLRGRLAIMVLVVALMSGCGELVFDAAFDALSIGTTALDIGMQGAAYSDSLTVSGGDGSYTWAIVMGTLPAGLSLDRSTGEIYGTPTVAGTQGFRVSVESGDGQSDIRLLSITIHGPLRVSTTSLPPGIEGTTYEAAVEAEGGDGHYTWSILDGSLPTGLTMDPSTGEISGTPPRVESATFTLRVESGYGQAVEVELSIAILRALELVTSSLPRGFTGLPYRETLRATGGDGPYVWSIVAGALPDGLSLEPSTGLIYGSPTSPGSDSFTVQVESGDGQTATEELEIGVYWYPWPGGDDDDDD